MLENVLTFIVLLSCSPEDEDLKHMILSEFLTAGIRPILEDIKTKISSDFYQIQDSSFEAVTE